MNKRRAPYPTDAPGPVDGGVSIEEARDRVGSGIAQFVKRYREHAGQARLVRASPGLGKSTALGRALGKVRVEARLVVGTVALAAEQAAEFGYNLVVGRNGENCERYDVVRALGDAGHSVEHFACGTPIAPRCPFRADCRYYAQFSGPGPRVGAAEQLYNPTFLRAGKLVALDDADLLRAAIGRSFIEPGAIERAREQLGGRLQPVEVLLRVVAHALVEAPGRGIPGAAAWDQLAVAAHRLGLHFEELVAALPESITWPQIGAGIDGYVTVEMVEAVPPSHLARCLDALREELPRFSSGEDFNSRIRLSRQGVEVAWLKDHVRDKEGKVVVAAMAMLVLDGTPPPALVDHIMAEHERLPDLDVRVALPASVTVVQYAGASNNHGALRQKPGSERVLAEVAAERGLHPVHDPEHEAAITYKHFKEQLVGLGFAPSQVLTFGSVRGTNALARVRRLHTVGRPMPPSPEIVFLAQVIHHDGPAVIPDLVLRPGQYGGQHWAVDVVDFADPRAAELLRTSRDDEVVQAIHRARLLAVPTQRRLESGAEREQVRLVLHTNLPIEGLRVDELVMGETTENVNDERRRDATRRIDEATAALRAAHEPITVSAVARVAHASRNTVAAALGKDDQTSIERPVSLNDWRRRLGTDDQTPIDLSLKGVIIFPQSSEATAVARSLPPRPPGAPSHWEPCRGGCGTYLPPGQKCPACACRAVEQWKQSERTRRRSPVQPAAVGG